MSYFWYNSVSLKKDRVSSILTFSNRSVKLFTLKNRFLITAKVLLTIRMCLTVQVVWQVIPCGCGSCSSCYIPIANWSYKAYSLFHFETEIFTRNDMFWNIWKYATVITLFIFVGNAWKYIISSKKQGLTSAVCFLNFVIWQKQIL